jgi:hypothetical protein
MCFGESGIHHPLSKERKKVLDYEIEMASSSSIIVIISVSNIMVRNNSNIIISVSIHNQFGNVFCFY